MPRVSDEHLAARRRQILDAARACFQRNGFHATSMQDVISEAGLSVGAVYRYYRSKNDLVTAIAEEVVGDLDEMLTGQVAADRPLRATLADILELLDEHTHDDGAFRLAVQVWAEAMRDPSLADFVARVYGRVRNSLVEIARRAQQRDELPADVGADELGAVLFSLLPGYALQKILTGTPDRAAYLAGVDALLRTRP